MSGRHKCFRIIFLLLLKNRELPSRPAYTAEVTLLDDNKKPFSKVNYTGDYILEEGVAEDQNCQLCFQIPYDTTKKFQNFISIARSHLSYQSAISSSKLKISKNKNQSYKERTVNYSESLKSIFFYFGV